MILKGADLQLKVESERPTKKVPVPKFMNGKYGDDAEMIVAKMNVEGYLRNSALQRKVLEMKDIDETRRTGLLMCASLISCIVDEDGKFLFSEDQLDAFHSVVDKDTLDALLIAQGELNPPKEIKSFDTKKKKS